MYKKLTNKLFLVLALVSGVIAFSSCSSHDYEWRRATLDIQFDMSPNPSNGYVDVSTTVYLDEIPEFNPSRERIVDLVTNDSWLNISNFLRGDYIDTFYIDVAGVGTYRYEIPIKIRQDDEIFTLDDNGYYNFMRDVNYLLLRDGAVDMRIRMYTNVYDGGPIYFDMQNNLDIEVRY